MSFEDRRHRLGMLSLIVATSGAVSACGMLIVHGPPPGHEQLASFSCTQSNAGSVVDIVWGGLNVLGAVAVSSSDLAEDVFEHPDRIAGVGMAWGALSGASAAVGFNKTRRCREAQGLLLARLQATSVLAEPASTTPLALISRADSIRVGTGVRLRSAAHSSSVTTIPIAWFIWTSSNEAIASVNSARPVSLATPGGIIGATRAETAVGTDTVVVTPN